MKRNWILLFTGVLLSLFLLPPCIADPNEYLFPHEELGLKLATVEIDNLNYSIYSINTSQEGNILVVNDKGEIPSDTSIKKSLFAYYTKEYFSRNNNRISGLYQETFNILHTQSKSVSQNILDLFKKTPEVCIKIPHLEFLSVCIKPTQDFGIVPLMSDLFVIDWMNILDTYIKLGGHIYYCEDNSGTIKYEVIIDLYKHLMSSHAFLEKSREATGINFVIIDMINPYTISLDADNKSYKDYENIKTRINSLSQEERILYTKVESEIDSAHIIIKKIIGLNKDVSLIREKENSIRTQIKSINLEDQKYRSDIDKLNRLYSDSANLKMTAEEGYNLALEEYNKKNFFAQKYSQFIGGLKSLSYY